MKLVRSKLRLRNYAARTEEIYTDWIKRFLHFYELKQDPRDMGTEEVVAFLDHLARVEKVAASTQNQALNALVFSFAKFSGARLGMSRRRREPNGSRGCRPC